MKLLDMLVDAGLNKEFEWPDGFYYCAQEATIDNTVVFCNRKMSSIHDINTDMCSWKLLTFVKNDSTVHYTELYSFGELAEDYQTSQITKQEYLSALDKAKKRGISKAEPEELKESEATKLNNIVKVDVMLESKLQTPSELWALPNMLTEYSRKKEVFSLLEKELDEKRKELYELQENIRTLCEQQGWRIEPV